MSALRPRDTRGIRELNLETTIAELARGASSRVNSRHSRATGSRSARVATGSSEGITGRITSRPRANSARDFRSKRPSKHANPSRGANHRGDSANRDSRAWTLGQTPEDKRRERFPLAGFALPIGPMFIRSSFSSYITHSVRVRKISLRSAVEIGKISSAEVSRRLAVE